MCSPQGLRIVRRHNSRSGSPSFKESFEHVETTPGALARRQPGAAVVSDAGRPPTPLSVRTSLSRAASPFSEDISFKERFQKLEAEMCELKGGVLQRLEGLEASLSTSSDKQTKYAEDLGNLTSAYTKLVHELNQQNVVSLLDRLSAIEQAVESAFDSHSTEIVSNRAGIESTQYSLETMSKLLMEESEARRHSECEASALEQRVHLRLDSLFGEVSSLKAKATQADSAGQSLLVESAQRLEVSSAVMQGELAKIQAQVLRVQASMSDTVAQAVGQAIGNLQAALSSQSTLLRTADTDIEGLKAETGNLRTLIEQAETGDLRSLIAQAALEDEHRSRQVLEQLAAERAARCRGSEEFLELLEQEREARVRDASMQPLFKELNEAFRERVDDVQRSVQVLDGLVRSELRERAAETEGLWKALEKQADDLLQNFDVKISTASLRHADGHDAAGLKHRRPHYRGQALMSFITEEGYGAGPDPPPERSLGKSIQALESQHERRW